MKIIQNWINGEDIAVYDIVVLANRDCTVICAIRTTQIRSNFYTRSHQRDGSSSGYLLGRYKNVVDDGFRKVSEN